MCGYGRAMRLAKGHVYLIAPSGAPKKWKNGKGKWPMKIGVSKSWEGVFNRLKDLSSGNWMKLAVYEISPEICEPYNVERFLHNLFAKNKLRGEWFDLSYADFENISRWFENEPTTTNPMSDWGRSEYPEMAHEWYAWDV